MFVVLQVRLVATNATRLNRGDTPESEKLCDYLAEKFGEFFTINREGNNAQYEWKSHEISAARVQADKDYRKKKREAAELQGRTG